MPAPAHSLLYKLGDATPQDHPWVFGNTFTTEQVAGRERLAIAPGVNHVDVLKCLLEVMPEPMWLLYVLVVPRGDDEAGRYKSSEPKSRDTVKRFLNEFKVFFETDGRHNVWIRSVTTSAMLIYDRHNLIYCYGNLEKSKALLKQVGLTEMRSSASIIVPDPHPHYYHSLLDADERRLLEYFDWEHTPLQEQDER